MIVVKIGGSAGVNIEAVCDDAASIIRAGTRLVIVHGASDTTNSLSQRVGLAPRFVTSPSGHTSRRTDRATLEVLQMACRGGFNQRVVEALQSRGVNAIGLSGMDARIWEGTRKDTIRAIEDGRTVLIRDDFTGTIDTVNSPLLTALLDSGLTPVLCPPAISTNHEPINVDADRAAAQTAAALGADRLLLLSNVPGLLRLFPDESSLITRIARTEIKLAQDLAQGRMKKKVLGAIEALEAGVATVVIGDARPGAPITRALEGAGTTFR
ncbi:MAG: [LysW]-aminoadipate kinase [Phycisphaeraceae bacterium]|nr:[LysW]-aminoadipate kinase [Phycisphaeraceae bacterium]